MLKIKITDTNARVTDVFNYWPDKISERVELHYEHRRLNLGPAAINLIKYQHVAITHTLWSGAYLNIRFHTKNRLKLKATLKLTGLGCFTTRTTTDGQILPELLLSTYTRTPSIRVIMPKHMVTLILKFKEKYSGSRQLLTRINLDKGLLRVHTYRWTVVSICGRNNKTAFYIWLQIKRLFSPLLQSIFSYTSSL